MERKSRVILISAVAIIFMAGTVVFTSCKDKKQAEEKQKQEDFEQNLQSYPSGFKSFVGKVVKNHEFSGKKSLGKIKLPKGMEIAYKKQGKTFSGKIEKPVYCLQKNGKTFLKNGLRVVVHGQAPLVRFSVEPFKGGLWRVNSIKPYNRFYALTITDRGGDHPGPAYESFEALDAIWGNPEVYVWEPHPDYIIRKGKKFYLIKENGEFWQIRPFIKTEYGVIPQ